MRFRPNFWNRTMAFLQSRLCPGVVGLVFLWAGVVKTMDPSVAADALGSFLTPSRALAAVAALAGLEIAVGASLLLGWTSRLLIGVAGALLVAFVGFLRRLNALYPEVVSCGCFGDTLEAWIEGGLTAGVLRNLFLLALLIPPLLSAAGPKTFRGRGEVAPPASSRIET